LQTYAISRWNACKHTYALETHTCNMQIYSYNIQIKHMQHTSKTDETLKNTLGTYVYNHYNICNWSTFCHIHLQHLKHISKTCNMRFSPIFFRTTQHRVEEQSIHSSKPTTVDAGMAWQRLAAPDVGPTSDDHLSWPHAVRRLPMWLLLAGMGRQGREGGRGSDRRRSVAKEKGEHEATSHKRPAPVPRWEDEQGCEREIC
jgi:hypothetical protein